MMYTPEQPPAGSKKKAEPAYWCCEEHHDARLKADAAKRKAAATKKRNAEAAEKEAGPQAMVPCPFMYLKPHGEHAKGDICTIPCKANKDGYGVGCTRHKATLATRRRDGTHVDNPNTHGSSGERCMMIKVAPVTHIVGVCGNAITSNPLYQGVYDAIREFDPDARLCSSCVKDLYLTSLTAPPVICGRVKRGTNGICDRKPDPLTGFCSQCKVTESACKILLLSRSNMVERGRIDLESAFYRITGMPSLNPDFLRRFEEYIRTISARFRAVADNEDEAGVPSQPGARPPVTRASPTPSSSSSFSRYAMPREEEKKREEKAPTGSAVFSPAADKAPLNTLKKVSKAKDAKPKKAQPPLTSSEPLAVFFTPPVVEDVKINLSHDQDPEPTPDDEEENDENDNNSVVLRGDTDDEEEENDEEASEADE